MSDLIIRRGMCKTAAPEDGPSFEQQFGILANALVAEKYPKLDRMKLAFQLIEKSEDNSKACGAAVYLVGKTVIFVPAFYRASKIRTGDMMLVAQTQQFLPLSDPWLAWLQSKDLEQPAERIGKGMEDTSMTASPRTIKDETDPIIKTASAYLRGLLRTDASPDKDNGCGSVLDTAIAMGKSASATMLDELVGSTDVLNATLRFYSGDEVDGFAKKAAEMHEEAEPVPEVSVVLPFTKEAAELSPEDAAVLLRDGYVIKRAADAPAPTVIRRSDIRKSFVTVSGPGKRELLRMDGTAKEALVMRSAKLSFVGMWYSETLSPYDRGQKSYGRPGPANTAPGLGRDLYNEGGLVALATRDGLPVNLAKDTLALATPDSDFTSDMLEGYGKALTPGNVDKISYGDRMLCPDGKAYEWHDSALYSHNQGWNDASGRHIVISADAAQTSPIATEHTIAMPQGTRFVRTNESDPFDGEEAASSQEIDKSERATSGKHSFAYVTWRTLDAFLAAFEQKNYRKVKVTVDGGDVHLSGDAGSSAGSVKEASLRLVKDYGVSPDIARSMLKGVRHERSGLGVETYMIEKTASADDPWENAALPMRDVSNRPEQRDTVEMPSVEGNPELLRQAVVQAANTGIKDVFDVSVLKLLIRQNKFMEEIHDDLPLFMRVLDSLCRKLFLFYWHTEEFEDQYGTVKLKSLEENLKNTIDSLSDITVFFKMRTVNADNGVGNDGGELMGGYDL